MGDKPITEHKDHPALIADRYQVDHTLGQGGMAVVYHVRDTSTGKDLALKQLLVKEGAEKREEISRLFEHEFHILTQLAHPGVIEVYDYGKDEVGPYYTMELLDGGDVRELSPMHWKKACSLLSDVCSALSLLHSRRQLHRDLTPRNIRCTRDAKAKLIDFGAMAPMGPCKQVIGTLSFTAPEVFALQTLDARSDLYSLGATLYYALTGRHAYPAKNFAELRDLWRSKPRLPSAYVEEIPKELDNLVLSLISSDPMARPVNAAEVMERLSAIAGIELGDQLLDSRSYLSTPTLVGRERPLSRVRKRLARAFLNRGGAIMIEGVSGVGRSRFLNACLLEGKLAGATVIKADASDAYAGNWGAVRAIVSRLLDALPELALEMAKPYISVLGHVSPELLSRFDASVSHGPVSASATGQFKRVEGQEPVFDPWVELWGGSYSSRPPPPPNGARTVLQSIDNPQELRSRVYTALCDWWLQIGRQRCLMVAIDDVHRIDEPSAAFIAVLTHEISETMLVIAVTAEKDAAATSAAAIKLIKETGDSITLGNLSLDHTEKLLGSIFGETRNIRLFADKIFAISQGNPRAIMQLAQHLVDKGLIRYHSGAWTLPSRIDVEDLPTSLSEALKIRAQKLSGDAFALAQTMALSAEQSFSYEECLILTEHRDAARLVQNLDELIAAEILTADGEYYSFGQQVWVSVLTDELDERKKRPLHSRLADMLGARGTEPFRIARHLLRAGQEERSLDVCIEYVKTFRERIAQSPGAFFEYIQSLPKDWIDTFETLIRICQKVGRPRKQSYWLQNALVTLNTVTGEVDKARLFEIIQQLLHDSGLAFYHQLGDTVDPNDRLWRALQMAQEQYDASPEFERVLPPIEAVGDLAQALITAINVAGNSFDHSLMESLPSLEPLIPLSSALDIVEKNVRSTFNITAGRYERARQGYLEILERVTQPDHAGLDQKYYEYTRLNLIYAIGMIEASLGLKLESKWIDELEAYPLYRINAWRIRMVYYLRQGDAVRAELCKNRVELLKIQNSPSQFFEGTHLLPEILVYSSSDDLIGVRQAIDDIRDMSKRFEAWVPVLHFARGEYQRIRGDYKNALIEFDKTMSLIAPGRHIAWSYAAAVYINTLFKLGRYREAKELGKQFVEAATKEDLGVAGTLIIIPMALSCAKLGEYERAVRYSEDAIDRIRSAGITGLNLGIHYEARARVAIFMNDEESFEVYAERCAEQYKNGHNYALMAKYETLMQDARQAKLRVSNDLARAAEFSEPDQESILSSVASMLTDCNGPQERAERALELLIERTNCSGGFLFTVQKEGPVLAAQSGNYPPPSHMDSMVKNYISTEIDDTADVTTKENELESPMDKTAEWTDEQEEKYRPLIIGHNTPEGFGITGLAILMLSPGKLFNFPGEAAAAISKSLVEAGDVTMIFRGNPQQTNSPRSANR